MQPKPLETHFRVIVSSESKVATAGLVLKLKHMGGESWDGGLFEEGAIVPTIPFVIDPAKPEATRIEFSIVEGGLAERFALSLRDDQIKKQGRQLAIAQSLGSQQGPFEETDIWVAEEEDPPMGGGDE